MKKPLSTIAVTITLILSVSSPVQSATSDFCKSISNIATSIMQHRQNGMGIVDALELNEKVKGDETVFNLANSIVTDAYSRNKYSADINKKSASVEFGNEYYLMCLKATM